MYTMYESWYTICETPGAPQRFQENETESEFLSTLSNEYECFCLCMTFINVSVARVFPTKGQESEEREDRTASLGWPHCSQVGYVGVVLDPRSYLSISKRFLHPREAPGSAPPPGTRRWQGQDPWVSAVGQAREAHPTLE